MNKNIFFILSFCFFFFGFVHKNSEDQQYQILSDQITTSEIEIYKFHLIASEIYAFYYDESITINLDWEKPYFSAYAHREVSGKFSINFWGGLARIPEMLEETWAFVVCHELGHILGGNPKMELKNYEWASSEGQSDHFAAVECLPKYFEKKYIQNFDDRRFLPYEVGYCSDTTSDNRSLFVCLKTLRAARGFFGVSKYMFSKENYDFHDHAPAIESTEINSYPSLQCRLDILKSKAGNNNSSERNNCWYK